MLLFVHLLHACFQTRQVEVLRKICWSDLDDHWKPPATVLLTPRLRCQYWIVLISFDCCFAFYHQMMDVARVLFRFIVSISCYLVFSPGPRRGQFSVPILSDSHGFGVLVERRIWLCPIRFNLVKFWPLKFQNGQKLGPHNFGQATIEFISTSSFR